MATRDRAVPRKKPRQERAKATVEALLEAAAQVLVSSGYEGTTTKQVAERAGVSIGTLYQYYPSKEALVAALVERLSQQLLAALTETLVPRQRGGMEEVTRELVRTLMGVYAVNPQLQRVLLEQAPRIGPLHTVQEMEVRVESIVRNSLSRGLETLRPRNLELAVFLLTRAVRGATWATVIERPELVGDPELEEELCAMVLGYLRREGSPPPHSGFTDSPRSSR
ncbi:TetR/AcrR family transcriptional regulator [Vitiosangium sp. GDMCC 1.1324]|uniref:TetR/AcrR family transcriptional regulator n=1 Tax=Vitiosangium sp. (strain GDMCC 1.1324) TaxID=2138576 RepID=UPI00130EA700|nr:TetR/AcrR family transcriptional regulator [Vitiosangium sp. GDMCC 1.1324]